MSHKLQFSGVSLLFLMCYLDYTHATAALVVPVFIARTALMNCTKALTRSIIMDSVPKVGNRNQKAQQWSVKTQSSSTILPISISIPKPHTQEARAKWNSLESVTGATWAGSAVVGGLLVDRYGFLLNNLATASLQLISTLPLFLVLGLVPREHTTAAGGLLYDAIMEANGIGGPGAGEEDEEHLSQSSARRALFSFNPEEGDDDGYAAAEEREAAMVAERLEEARRLVGRGDPALDAPLEEERDLGLLERLLKGGGGGRRSRAATIEESQG